MSISSKTPASMPLRPLNVEPALLEALHEHIWALNSADAALPGRPAVEIARSKPQTALAARLMAQAFIHNQDRGWLAWLPPSEVARVHSGDTRRAQEKIARVIDYLCAAAAFEGGLVLLESADVPPGREIRGASLWGLPPAVPGAEPWWHLAAHGAPARFAQLRAGARGGRCRRGERTGASLAGDDAPPGLSGALHLRADKMYPAGAPGPARFAANVRAVPPAGGPFQPRVQAREQQPRDQRPARFLQLPLREDRGARFGASRFNSVGPYAINLMIRRPRPEVPCR
jgi:hypothetical protein